MMLCSQISQYQQCVIEYTTYGYTTYGLNPYKPSVLDTVNSAYPDQTPHNAASDQGLNCLLSDCYIKN